VVAIKAAITVIITDGSAVTTTDGVIATIAPATTMVVMVITTVAVIIITATNQPEIWVDIKFRREKIETVDQAISF
jgi:hypothetical protein